MSADVPGVPPLRLSVSQVRVAAACPRVAYFDHVHTWRNQLQQPRVSRLWTRVDDAGVSGLGALFHQAVERFHKLARQDEALLACLADSTHVEQFVPQLFLQLYRTTVPHARLFSATGEQQQAFMNALRRYSAELAEILWYGRERGIALPEMREQMFGDQRRQVDVSFRLGGDGKQVNVCGRLDYVFFDWRSARRRIIDYKLTPPDQPVKDLFQISLYALMHHIQHGTRPDAAVLYIHPQRKMLEKSWDEIQQEQNRTFHFLASLREWLAYDETAETGLKPPGDPAYCRVCPWEKECVARLGPKTSGSWLEPWDVGAVAPEARAIQAAIGAGTPPTTSDAPTINVCDEESAFEVNSQNDTLCVGTWEADDQLAKIGLDALTMHGFVAGAAGSGKTWTAKVLLEEAVRCGTPVIAVDPQGDLAQFHALQPMSADEAPRWRQLRQDFVRRREVRIWTPGSWIGLRLALDPLRLNSVDSLETAPDQEARREIEDQLLTSAAANLVSLAQAGGELESQQTLLMQIMRRLVRRTGGELTLTAVVEALRDPSQVGLDEPDHVLRRSERQKLARMLNNLQEGTAAPLFQRGCPLDIETFFNPFEPGKIPLNVIYLNHLVDDRQKQFIVAVLANEIYRWMMMREREQARRLMFYLDEARDFLPAGNRQTAAKIPLRRLFSQGRKYGVCCLAAAQSPRSIEYEALSNCSTKLIGRLESQQDVERVREWFARESTPPEWLAGRKGASAGSFVGRWPAMDAQREGESLRARPLFSQHAGAWSPDRIEREMADDPWRRVLRERCMP